MKLTHEGLIKSSERILHNLLIDDDTELLLPEDVYLIELPLVDFLLRKFNKQEYINDTRYRYIKCVLCDKKFRIKDKYQHKNTSLHKYKIKLSIQADENLSDKDIYIEVKEENIN